MGTMSEFDELKSSFVGFCDGSKRYVDKEWGNELHIVNHEYCGKLMILNPGCKSSIHRHNNKRETFYVASGAMVVDLLHPDGSRETCVLRRGGTLTIEPLTWHRFMSSENCLFYEFSTHDDPEDNDRRTKSGKMKPEDHAHYERSLQAAYEKEEAESGSRGR